MDIVQGRTDIVRDPKSGAIINVDGESYSTAISARKARQNAKEQLKNNTKLSGNTNIH